MIFILLTTHESRRFPGKNGLLARFTMEWAAAAALYCEEDVCLVHAGPVRPGWLPPRVRHVQVDEEMGHLAAVQAAERVLAPQVGRDVLVLAQLTQPLRHVCLLADVVEACRRSGRVVVTAARQPDAGWRCVDRLGRWGDKALECDVLRHDGSLYAWEPGRAAEVFDRSVAHAVVEDGCRWCLVDVDVRGDLPGCLPTLWAHALHGEGGGM